MIKVKSIQLTICVAILFTFLSRPSPVSACSCDMTVSPDEEFARQDAIFTGKVVRIADNYFPYFSKIDQILSKLGFQRSLYSYRFLDYERWYGCDIFFEVINSWKGVEKTSIKVNTGRGGGDCGYSFEMDKEYLIYASHAYGIPGNYWVTGICSRNALLLNATDDLNSLNPLAELPLKFSVPIPWAEKDSLTLVLVVVIVGIIVFAIRRLR